MAFNPYQTISAIYNLKGEWEKHNAAGDTAGKNRAAQQAQAYYRQLIEGGYADVAEKLKNSDYAQAKYIRDYYAKQGKSAIRPYLYSAGEKYGLAREDIDNALSFDPVTGEVSLGGKNIGKPYSIVDGVSYWDTSVLDTGFDDYLKRTGVSSSLADRTNKRLYDKGGMYDTEYGKYGEQFDIAKADPLSTPTGKSILERYDAAGIKARDNAFATGAAGNAGNVDSYAAANAMRQNAALRGMGEQAAIAAHSAKVANMGASLAGSTALLQQLGIAVRGVSEDERAALNDRVSREAVQAQVTGYVPQTMAYRDNPYFNPDGTLKNENLDYSAIIANARTQLAGNSDPKARADLQHTIDMATQARNYKITSNPVYAKYADTMSLTASAPTAAAQAAKQAAEEAAAQRGHELTLADLSRLSKSGGTGKSGGSGKAGGGAEKSKLTPAQVIKAFNDGIRTPGIVNEYNRLYGTNEAATPSGRIEPLPEPEITNRNDKDWIFVSGYGRITWQQLEDYLRSGDIKETFTSDDEGNTYVTYTAAR